MIYLQSSFIVSIVMNQPKLFEVTSHIDPRGILKYSNEFTFPNVKRFYHIQLPKKSVIRAFHGHMVEEKFVYIIQGSVKIILAPLNNPIKPSKNIDLLKFILDSKKPKILHIPSRYANGLMSLEKNSEVIFYSTLLLEDSMKDDYRFEENYWGENVWKE